MLVLVLGCATSSCGGGESPDDRPNLERLQKSRENAIASLRQAATDLKGTVTVLRIDQRSTDGFITPFGRYTRCGNSKRKYLYEAGITVVAGGRSKHQNVDAVLIAATLRLQSKGWRIDNTTATKGELKVDIRQGITHNTDVQENAVTIRTEGACHDLGGLWREPTGKPDDLYPIVTK
ncbi:hypothetical protein SMC26_14025 [Actinomadura fulvescens]